MRLRTLGGLSVEQASYSREKPLLLLAYLCVEGAQPRRRLAALFWPEAANPMNSLAQHLIRLRPLAGAVQEDGGRVAARCACDVALFRSHDRAGRQAEALEVYGGPFLDGLGVDLGPDLEEWLFETREALGREARAAHLTLAERRLALGDAAGAAAGAERAYLPPGAPPPDPGDLLRLWRLLRAGGHPLAETVRREADDLGVPLSLPAATPSAPPLLGRVGERSALDALRPGEVAWISGPPGIGKSALLGAVAAGGGWRVLPGRAGLPLVSLEPLAPRLAGTADVLAALADPHLRVVLDGWEDADDATRVALTLAARQRPGAALVVAARGPPTLPTDLHLTLGPLTSPDLAAHPGAFEATAGAPALLAAFLRGAPPHQTLDAHLNALPPPAREVYLTLALQPAPDLAATRAALGLTAAAFTHTLDRLTREGLCAPGGEVRTPGPAQELATASSAQTALRHLQLARAHREGRGWTHWHAARTLWEEEDQRGAALAAHAHAREAMKRGYPAQAAATLEEAPQTEAVRLLRGWALIHSGRMVEALEVTRNLPEIPDVLAVRATACFRTGRNRECADLAGRVALDGSPASAHAATVLGLVARYEERYREARSHFRRSANLWQLHGNLIERVQALSLAAQMQCRLGGEPELEFRAALEAGRGVPGAAALALVNYGVELGKKGETDASEDALREAAAAFELAGNQDGCANALNALGTRRHLAGDLTSARSYYAEAAELCVTSGNVRLLGLVLSNLSEIEGDLDRFEDALALLDQTGQTRTVQFIRRNVQVNSFPMSGAN